MIIIMKINLFWLFLSQTAISFPEIDAIYLVSDGKPVSVFLPSYILLSSLLNLDTQCGIEQKLNECFQVMCSEVFLRCFWYRGSWYHLVNDARIIWVNDDWTRLVNNVFLTEKGNYDIYSHSSIYLLFTMMLFCIY